MYCVFAVRDIDLYLAKCRTIPGWMPRTDGIIFEFVSNCQLAAGVTADILEVGSYHGRSAILLGYLLAPGERLFLCDLFEDQPGIHVRAQGKRHYVRLSLAGTAANYARFHATPATMFRCPSTELLPRGLVAPPFRLIHIDGSHEPDVMRQDLATALHLLVPGGVVIFEDDHSVHRPGVPPAVQAAFEAGTLSPLAITPGKTYAVAGADVHGLVPRLAEWARAGDELRPEMVSFAGRETMLLFPRPESVNASRGLERKVGRLNLRKAAPEDASR